MKRPTHWLLAALLTASGLCAAAEDFPNRSITMIVPFPPGGLADLVGRPVAQALAKELGQPVAVENKGGAGGGVGMAATAKAKPDGYTVVLALSSFTTIPEADALMGRAPMYALSDLRPIVRYTADPTVLAVRADAPWKTLKDFLDDAKKRPGAINYGSSGYYGTMHLPMALLEQQASVKMTHVPYKGAGPAVVALLGKEIDAVSSGPATVLQHVKAGKLRVLAHWGEGTLASMPDVPSIKDSGMDVSYAQWSGLFIPAGVPEAVAQRLRKAAVAAAKDAKVNEVINKAGSPVLFMDELEFASYVKSDAAKMAGVVKKIGKVN